MEGETLRQMLTSSLYIFLNGKNFLQTFYYFQACYFPSYVSLGEKRLTERGYVMHQPGGAGVHEGGLIIVVHDSLLVLMYLRNISDPAHPLLVIMHLGSKSDLVQVLTVGVGFEQGFTDTKCSSLLLILHT